MGCGMSKTLEQKLQKAGEEIAESVVDAAVDLTVSVVKDASALGQEVAKDAIADAKEIVEKKMAEVRRSMDSSAANKAVDAVIASVVVTTPTIVLKLPCTVEVEGDADKESEPVAPEPIEEEKK
jgi:hypothetical protein